MMLKIFTYYLLVRPTIAFLASRVLGGIIAFAYLAFACEAENLVSFNRDIRPILSNHCFACHGPDANARKSELRLDIRTSALDKKAIVPAEPFESGIVNRIYHEDLSKRMPPIETKQPLSPEQKTLLRRWIAEGADYSEHWAWIPPRRSSVPTVEDMTWPRNEIDHFILAQLEEKGLSPSPEADQRTLIRRLSLDLTGLPPTPKEVENFIIDSSDDVYGTLVDRLLKSPRFGERMALHWLDLARYADSDGYHDDTARAMWPYRDYVIKSFCDNKPFDVFTLEQIAGDQIPNATREQKVGSAFHRNGPTSSEGGANPEEYRVKYAVDRVNTTATVWLGVTLQCAECHDHKFDPFTQREFYQFLAFFDQVPGDYLFRGLYAPPSIELSSSAQEAELAALEASITALKKQAKANVNSDEIIKQKLLETTELYDEFRARIPKLRIMQDVKERTPTHILLRGDFRKRGELVEPGVPALLPPLTGGKPSRLTLGKWLVDPKNPLPARVTVNRFWAMLFGTGIVKTGEDFGSQGEWPSHLELLDWLAVEFIESGWDVKHILKYIVGSATYRQSSITDEVRRKYDPENRLLTRGPRFRLPAEMIRDNALYVAGLLVEKRGGPSVKPYQPPGLWKEMAYGDSPGKAYEQDHGDNLYRRGLYTFWKRSILYPAFAAFDAPIREECTVRRPRTNTPLQAFVMLNDITFVEAARVFAERILVRGGSNLESRIDFAMKTAVARSPSPIELLILKTLLADMIDHYLAQPNDAGKIIAVGEWPVSDNLDPIMLAAWTSVAQAILNLDEMQTKE